MTFVLLAAYLNNCNITIQRFPGLWDISAAGHVEAGVSNSRETAVREVAEELGIEVKDPNSEFEFAFTCPAAAADWGWGGCNAFEDVYFLRRDRK